MIGLTASHLSDFSVDVFMAQFRLHFQMQIFLGRNFCFGMTRQDIYIMQR